MAYSHRNLIKEPSDPKRGLVLLPGRPRAVHMRGNTVNNTRGRPLRGAAATCARIDRRSTRPGIPHRDRVRVHARGREAALRLVLLRVSHHDFASAQ